MMKYMHTPGPFSCCTTAWNCANNTMSIHVIILVFLLGVSFSIPPTAFPLEYQKGTFSGSLGGSVDARMPVRFDWKTPEELPSLVGTVKVDGSLGERISLHCVVRGGYDGASQHPSNSEILLGFDKVYPSVDRYIEFPEAYLTLALPSTDLRLGIQKFSWGTLDQFNPTDNLSPLDLRHFLDTSEALDRKIGVPAVRITQLAPLVNINVEAVWIPFLVPYRMSDPGDRWYPPLFQMPPTVVIPPLPAFPVTLPPISVYQTNDEPDLPARTFTHSEFGIRISRTFGSTDIGLSYFNGYDRMPIITDSGTVIADVNLLPPALNVAYDIHVFPFFPRVQIYGMDMQASWRSFTFRAEGAYVDGKFINVGLEAVDDILRQFRFPPLSEFSFECYRNGVKMSFPFSPTIAYQKDLFSLGAGVDYQWGNHLITLTVIGQYLMNYHGEPLVYEEFEIMNLIALHNRFWDDTLQIESGLLINPMENLILFSSEATYAVTDSFKVGANLLALDGKAETPLGQFRKNDQIVIFFRYHF